MDLISRPDKLTFIVDTLPSFSFPKSGGSIATHKLAFELAERGHYVYIFNEPFYPHENIHVIPTESFPFDDGWTSTYNWEGFNFNPNRTVAVYTQVTWGNPFNTNHVARWMLHDYDPEIWKTYGQNESFFNYGTFHVPHDVFFQPLTVFDYKFDLYVNFNDKGRKGFGHILHKFTPDWGIEFLSRIGSTEIPNYHGRKDLDYLVDYFNKFEYVLTFDDKSYLTTAAALCGAKAIILNPNSDTSPHEFRCKNPIQANGVAYGFNDIKHADLTLDLVKSHLLELEQKDKKTINNFIKFWEQKVC
jgi:hypothetical protein